MRYKNEDDIKKALNIDSWKKLSKDKIVEFSTMMPDMDKDVILNRIKQLPEFTKFAFEALNVMQKEHETTTTANKQNQENVHESYQDVRTILGRQLDREDLTQEERNRIYGLLFETLDQESDDDSKNKKFLDGLFNKSVAGTGAIVLTAIVFVGGQVILKRR